MAKKQRRKQQHSRNRNIVRRSPDRLIDPVIDGEYVDPNVTIAGNPPPVNPVTTTAQGRRRTATVQTEAISFQGPIPPPQLLREYNEIIPDGADRILKMAEAQSAHRIQLETIVVKGDDRRANWGLFTGYTIGIVILVLSFILIMYGHDVAGTVLGSVDLIGLIGIFVYGRSVTMKELQRKSERNQALTRRG